MNGPWIALLLFLAMQVAPRTSFPRTQGDGKPDFTGVWAGPGFSGKVGPGDTEPNILIQQPPAWTLRHPRLSTRRYVHICLSQ